MKTWFTSDTHFGHHNIIGHASRPFSSTKEMDDTLVARWNECVRPGDRVYHLGDFAWRDSYIPQVRRRLNGTIRLVLGNHDEVTPNLYEAFQRIRLWEKFREHRFVCSHIPLPPDQMEFQGVLNVHGHIHEKDDPSPNHLNISVERTDYRPISLEEIVSILEQRGL